VTLSAAAKLHKNVYDIGGGVKLTILMNFSGVQGCSVAIVQFYYGYKETNI